MFNLFFEVFVVLYSSFDDLFHFEQLLLHGLHIFVILKLDCSQLQNFLLQLFNILFHLKDDTKIIRYAG
jgi:hypothetical protein